MNDSQNVNAKPFGVPTRFPTHPRMPRVGSSPQPTLPPQPVARKPSPPTHPAKPEDIIITVTPKRGARTVVVNLNAEILPKLNNVALATVAREALRALPPEQALAITNEFQPKAPPTRPDTDPLDPHEGVKT